jgi:3-hydroxyisobutyrate dehydrogenase-like beta-hydroxyacid dehydrogenase
VADLGFVGLGTMGGRIARRLLDAGHQVTGYNRTRSKAVWLLDAGMRWADSPRAVAEVSEVIFSMVTNTSALQSVVDGDDGLIAGLAPDSVYVDMSTVSPAVSRGVAERVTARGARMLDAPVSGSPLTLDQGQISIMVGGDRATFERIEPLLLAIGPKLTYVGANGLAVTMKIAINLSLAVQYLAFSEGLLLAEKSGIARETALQAILQSVVASPSLKYRGPFVLAMPEEAWFDVNMMQKDMLLALELGRNVDVPLPSVAIANELLTAARAQGLGHRDFAIMFEVLARMSGLSAAPEG